MSQRVKLLGLKCSAWKRLVLDFALERGQILICGEGEVKSTHNPYSLDLKG